LYFMHFPIILSHRPGGRPPGFDRGNEFTGDPAAGLTPSCPDPRSLGPSIPGRCRLITATVPARAPDQP